MSEVSILLSGYQNDVQTLILKGIPLKWESFVHSYDLHVKQLSHLSNGTIDRSVPSGRGESKHVQFVREFGAAVSVLQSRLRLFPGEITRMRVMN
jgi:dynein heavy chain 1